MLLHGLQLLHIVLVLTCKLVSIGYALLLVRSHMDTNKNYYKYQTYSPTDSHADSLGYVHFASQKALSRYIKLHKLRGGEIS